MLNRELQSSQCLCNSTAGVTRKSESVTIGKFMWKMSWSCLWMTGQMNAISLYNKMDLVFCGKSLTGESRREEREGELAFWYETA